LVFPYFYKLTFLRIWLAHIVDRAGVIEESQENAKNVKRHKAYERFSLLRKGNTKEKQNKDNAPATTAIGHRTTRTLMEKI